MDKWFLINQLLAFRARERHARQPPEQKIESTLTSRKLVRIPLWTFFLLRTRPPSPDDHPDGVWAALRYITVRRGLGAKYRRRCLGARETTGGPRYYRLLRRAADVVAGPRPRARAVGDLQAVLGAVKYRRRGLGAREVQRQPKPPLWPAGTLGCKKRAKRQPQREVLTTRLQHQGIDAAGTL